jgi:hypothetical protein
VTLEVTEPPVGDELRFWALQASFVDRGGRRVGAGHLGLQRHAPHPGGAAVNWGGYAEGGAILEGSGSALPSTTGNPHTRDLAWTARRPYRLRIEAVGTAPDGRRGAFRGSVRDLVTGQLTVVRDLWAMGDRLDAPMVWSEVFAPCEAPPSDVRWSDLEVIDEHATAVTAVTVNYQSLADGGCVTTTATTDGTGFVQRTGVPRTTPQGSVLRCDAQSRS